VRILRPRRSYLGYAYIALAASLWGFLGPLSELAFRQGLSPLSVAFWRALLGCTFFGLHSWVQKSKGMRARDLPLIIAFGLVGVTFFYLAYQMAVREAGVALAAILLYTAPAWVALLAWRFLKEPMGKTKLLSLLFVLSGVVLISWRGAPHPHPLGILWGIAAGVSYALYYLLGKPLFQRYPTSTVMTLLLLTGTFGLLPFHPSWPTHPAAWALVLLIAGGPTYLAYLAYSAGLRRLEATHASLVATLEPLVAALAAYLLFGEQLLPTGYLGALLILGGIVRLGRQSPSPTDSKALLTGSLDAKE